MQAAVYQHLLKVQGTAIPLLVAAGELGWPENDTVSFIASLHAGVTALEVPLTPGDITRALWCMQQIHDAGVLHQDLHPGNVLIDIQVGS